MAYFRYTQRAVFGPKNGISPKSLKLPQNNFIISLKKQKWCYLVKKHTLQQEKCEISKKWHIFGTYCAVFGPKNGISPKSLKLPQNNFITSLKTKNGDIWWINTTCKGKNVKLKKKAYFWYALRRFWPENGISLKSLKLPQNNLTTNPKTKNGDIWWRNIPCSRKNVKFQKNDIFSVHSVPFLAPKMGFRQNR